jgi:hypothetical protein
MNLTIEQMEFLQARGLSLTDVIEFAKLSPEKTRSANAERQARFRNRRRQKNDEGVTNNVTGNALLPPYDSSTPPVPSNDGNTPAAKRGRDAPPAKPDGVSDQTWGDFNRVRNKKRSPLTQTALDGIAAEAAKAGWTLEAALAKAVTRGWQGFEADWLKPEERRNGGTPGSTVDPLVASILAKKARENAGLSP